jgi:uncharacterized membrane protein YfcA
VIVDPTLLLLLFSLSSLVGLTLGLLGGGGSLLAVPLLVYVAGLPPDGAIATSLLVVGVASAAAIAPHARSGRVRWADGLVLGAATMVGAYAAGRVARFVPPATLLALFAVVAFAAAVAMARGPRAAAGRAPEPPRPLESAGLGQPAAPRSTGRAIALGVALGAITGLVGAGGGFLVVPALVLSFGLPMSEAVGTSLVVIALNALAGFAGYLHHAPIEGAVTAAAAAGAVCGSFVGGRLVGRVPPLALRRAFAVLTLAASALMLARELPRTIGGPADIAALAHAAPLIPRTEGDREAVRSRTATNSTPGAARSRTATKSR